MCVVFTYTLHTHRCRCIIILRVNAQLWFLMQYSLLILDRKKLAYLRRNNIIINDIIVFVFFVIISVEEND